MSKFLYKLFFVIYSIYSRWKDFDAFYHSAFIIGVLFASLFTFLSIVLYKITEDKMFYLEGITLYTLWFSVIGIFIFYYYRRKEILIKFYSENQLDNSFLIYYLILGLIFLTWFITPFLY